MKKQVSQITEYLPGTLRTRRRFAWLPKRVKEFKIWLMWYEELWVFRREIIPGIAGGEEKSIVKNYWDKIDEKL